MLSDMEPDPNAETRAPEEATQLEPPQRIAHYLLGRKLGQGGQGVVYLAQDERLGRTVALKILHLHHATLSPRVVERFLREAEVASSIDHPGICSVHDAGNSGGTFYIAMRHVKGVSLTELFAGAPTTVDEGASTLTNIGPTAAAEASDRSSGRSAGDSSTPSSRREVMRVVQIIEKTARALHHAHEAGVIHRDIKPGNIMVTPDDDPVILDFGLARINESDSQTLTRTGEIMGTPAYMSPEQLRAAGPVDARTDIFSLGVTLYEGVTGRRPFSAPTSQELFQAILTKDPMDPRRLNSTLPNDLSIVVQTALEKSLDRRYHTALALAEDLRAVREREPIQARPASALYRVTRWCQRNRGLAAAAVMGFALFCVAPLVTLSLVTLEQRQTSAALELYTRLADAERLMELREEARALWPPTPELLTALDDWVRRAADLESRLAGHRANLKVLRTLAVPATDELRERDRRLHPAFGELADQEVARMRIDEELRVAREEIEEVDPGAEDEGADVELARELAAIDARIQTLRRQLDSSSKWHFSDPEKQWLHDQLEALVEDLARFCDPQELHGNTLADLRARHRFAGQVLERSVLGAAAASAWAKCVADLKQHAAYGGLTLSPQIGLLPIGKDPRSQLWEFAHLQSGEPAERGEDGELARDAGSGLVLVLLPGGAFAMGAQTGRNVNRDPEAQRDESPVHEIVLDAFLVSKYEMTQAQWMRVMGTNPSGHASTDEPRIQMHPVESLDWLDAAEALRRLDLTLPTEAQWEYACRAGTSTPWSTGEKRDTLRGAANVADEAARRAGADWEFLDDLAGYDDGYALHAPVGGFLANGWGLHDFHGNVWEWVRDLAGDYGFDAPRSGDGLRTPTSTESRVARGGAYDWSSHRARSSARLALPPEMSLPDLGLRPARALR